MCASNQQMLLFWGGGFVENASQEGLQEMRKLSAP
jgi:hypothetical protein